MDFEDTVAATSTPIITTPRSGASDELLRGTAVGRYLLLGKLGAGAMGVVYAAHDPELDRKVALKLLLPRDGHSDIHGRARLLREAQALAKLSHPNVVAVYDVGTHGDQVWIAMEFVAGLTLGAWAMQRPRRWPELLQVLVDTARGVAAAHEAGLVHRDLKPDNVMIDRGGRVRVMDFGLAHGRSLAETEPALASTLSSGAAPPEVAAIALRLTAAGSVQGTPAYMAPEQWEGHEAGANADQFGWSVMAWELLYGERPFAGATLVTLAATVLSGQRRPPPTGRSIPAWLRRVLERGLAVDPARRWPAMTVLLAGLERGKSRARVRTGALLLAGALVLGVGAEAYRRSDIASTEAHRRSDIAQRESACEAAGASIDMTWNDTTREQVRDSFVKTGVRGAADTANRAISWLDHQAQAWKSARTDACMDHELRGLWSAELLDRGLWCLDDRRMVLEALVGELARADKAVLQKAVPAAAGLQSVAECRDAAMLSRLPAPPTEGRAEARAVRAEFARLSSLAAAGRFKELAEVATAARSRAEALAWPPLVAEAGLWTARSLELQGTWAEAAVALEDAGFAAMQAGALGIAADASIGLVMLAGQKLAHPEEGLRWARFADLALAELEPRPGLRSAAKLANLALVRSHQGAYAEARGLHEQALAIYEGALGPDHLLVATTLQSLTHVHLNMAAFGEALAANDRALAIREATLGPDHIDVGISLTSRAVVLRNLGRFAEALPLAQRSLRITEAVLGPDHPNVAVALTNVANIQMQIQMNDDVIAWQERGLAIREKALGPEHPDVAASLSNLGGVLMMKHEFERARPLLVRALAIREKVFGGEHREVATSVTNLAIAEQHLGAKAVARTLQARALAILEKTVGPEHPNVAEILIQLGELDREAAAYPAAKGRYERALAIIEKVLGEQHPRVEAALTGLAAVALATRRPGEAVALAERAVTAAERRGAAPEESVEARFLLAQALWDAPADAGRDRGLALVQARAALAEYRKDREAQAGVREVERWLAKRRG